MRILLLIPGVTLLIFGMGDLLCTTFLEGAGRLTILNCEMFSRLVYFLYRRFRNRRILEWEGLITVITTVMMWTFLVWIGWSLIFCAGRNSVVYATTHAPTGILTRFYFAGTTVITLGLGDYQPSGPIWKLATVAAGGSGFFLVGLAIAYIVPVVSAVTQKRQLALSIWGLGKSPDAILIRAWNGVDTTALVPHLVSLTTMLALLSENHSTYPILHFFHSRKRSSSIAPRVAALDEALTILECGLQSGCSLDVPSLGAAREAISEFLQTLKKGLVTSAAEAPPNPSLKSLREVGIPAVDETIFNSALKGVAARRKLLLALVRNEGWTWDDVWAPENPSPAREGN